FCLRLRRASSSFSSRLSSDPVSSLFPYTTLFRSLLGELGPAFLVVVDQDQIFHGEPPQVNRTATLRIDSPLQNIYDAAWPKARLDRKSTRLNSSHRTISYAVFCLKKKKHYITTNN